jgi:hypothetical protein
MTTLLGTLLWIFKTVGGAFGIGVRLLDYRPVAEGVYDATKWVTVLYFPLVPLGSVRLRPRTATAVNLGAVVETHYQADVLGVVPTTASRVVRMFAFAWVAVPLVMGGPVAGAIVFAKTHDGGAPSSLKTLLIVGAVVWGVVVAGVLNHRREKLYDWKSVTTETPAQRT